MKPGRPSQPRLTQDAILTEALSLLDTGDHALTLRALATRLGVTPMAVQHHIGTRDALIRALADHAYADIAAPDDGPDDGPPQARLRTLITAYAAKVRAHPHLTLALFRIQGPLPSEAQRITDTLEALLLGTGLAAPKARLWRDILIDWAHGAALAQSPDSAALDTLLAALNPE
jgi:AcrR family transcriptional regulator